MHIRLQKVLSSAGVASRRAAEKLIVGGRVSVNGATITQLGSRADPEVDDIRVDGRRIVRPRRRYLALHKPRGYVTTRSDPEQRPTVLDLVGHDEYLYPVGRLDYDSEGLLLLTNDGELAERLMHPRYGIEREYEARIRGVPQPATVRRLAEGVRIEGRRSAPARVRVVETGRGARGDQAILSIVLHEGRTRQVRKMCEAVGHPVVRLRRVRVGPIRLGALKAGEFRELTREEVRALEAATRTEGGRPEDPGRGSRPASASPDEGTRRQESEIRSRGRGLQPRKGARFLNPDSFPDRMSQGLIIAIDGPSGVGKGTIARRVAVALGYRHFDTGAMYRAVGWAAMERHVALDAEDEVAAIARAARFEITETLVAVDGHDVTHAIRTPRIDKAASVVSRLPRVREILVGRQRALGAGGGVVMEGRDIGTVVFPNADVKVYLDAAAEERARRRAADPAHAGSTAVPLTTLAAEMRARDRSDQTRETSPLRPAADAHVIDTTRLSIDQVVERVLAIVRTRTET